MLCVVWSNGTDVLNQHINIFYKKNLWSESESGMSERNIPTPSPTLRLVDLSPFERAAS